MYSNGLTVPQNVPQKQCQCGNFFISKRGFIVKGFWGVLEVFIHIFIHVHSFWFACMYSNGLTVPQNGPACPSKMAPMSMW